MSENGEAPRRLRLTAVDRQTPHAWHFTFGPAAAGALDGFTYEPGQVALLETLDGRVSYIAIASPPASEGAVEFLIKGAGPVGQQLFQSDVGAELLMTGPFGTGFPVEEHEGRDLVFVAQGTAIGAVRSALLHAVARRERFGSIAVIYGVRTPDDFNFTGEFDVWRGRDVKLELTCTQPGAAWVGAEGRVQALLEEALRHTLEPVAMVAGSPQMVEECTGVFGALGLPRERVLRNY